MGNRFKKLACLVMSFSMILSFSACAKKDSKAKDEDSGCVSAAQTFLDAAVRLQSKKINKLHKSLGLNVSIENKLNDIAANPFISRIMSKADYEIDEENIKETEDGATVKAKVLFPDYIEAMDGADNYTEFEENLDSQKKKNYQSVSVKLKLDIDDGEYSMTEKNAESILEKIYHDMSDSYSDFERQIATTTTTTEPTITTTEPTDTVPDPDTGSTYSKDLGSGPVRINMFTMNEDIVSILNEFLARNPDFDSKYSVRVTVVLSDSQKDYPSLLTQALINGDADSPDLYMIESEQIFPFTQGDVSGYAAPYSDFIDDFDSKLADAQIGKYIAELGTSPDGKVIGLAYQGCGGVMIYSSSIAMEVFGTADPAEIEKVVGAGSGSWDKFKEACKHLADRGYAACADIEDLWYVCRSSAETPWVVDDHANIDPKREAYLDLAREMIDNNWTNETGVWSTEWHAAMQGNSKNAVTGDQRKVFAFFGPAWFINFMVGSYCTTPETGLGDWRVCRAPADFWWGSTWLMASRKGAEDPDKKEFISRFVEWVTLDTTKDGLQYSLANGLLFGTKDAVASGRVLSSSDGSLDLLGGQNMFPHIAEAQRGTTARGVGIKDKELESEFVYQAGEYAHGRISRDEAIRNFLEACESNGIYTD